MLFYIFILGNINFANLKLYNNTQTAFKKFYIRPSVITLQTIRKKIQKCRRLNVF